MLWLSSSFLKAVLPSKYIETELLVHAVFGAESCESPAYIKTSRPICRKLFMQAVRCALALTALMAGNNNAARIPMMAMTTSNSIKVKADLPFIFNLRSIDNRIRRADHSAMPRYGARRDGMTCLHPNKFLYS